MASGLCCLGVDTAPHLRFNFSFQYPRVEWIDLDISLNSNNYPIIPRCVSMKMKIVLLCCLRALLGSTAQKLRAYGVGPRKSTSYISYSPSYGLWAQEKFKWGIIRGRKIDEEAITRWRCMI